MTDRELLEALYREMQDMKGEMQDMKGEMQDMKGEMQDMKGEMQTMKGDMQTMKEQIQILDRKVTKVELTLENETNHNIQLLAENHINLVDKLNQAIKVQDKSILYEVQVSGLKMKIEQLEREIADIKSKIA